MTSRLSRFLVYGVLGWAAEVAFTGVASALRRRDRLATARTYLCMHPIYGGAALVLEHLHARLRAYSHPTRLLGYVGAIYAAEAASGVLLRSLLGEGPWDYLDDGVNLGGLVRLDYAPAWLGLAARFEPLEARLVATLPVVATPRVSDPVVALS